MVKIMMYSMCRTIGNEFVLLQYLSLQYLLWIYTFYEFMKVLYMYIYAWVGVCILCHGRLLVTQPAFFL